MKTPDPVYSSAYRDLPAPLIITDVKGIILWANPECESALGYPAKDLLNKNIMGFAEKKDNFSRIFKTLKPGEAANFYELIRARARGISVFRSFEVKARTMIQDSKIIYLFLLIGYYPPAEWMRHSYIDTLQVPYVLLDQERRILDFNQGFQEMILHPGLFHDDLRGKSFYSLIQNQSARRLKKNIRDAAAYLQMLHGKSRSGWKLIHDGLLDSEALFRKQWILPKTADVLVRDRRLVLRSKRFLSGDNYVIFREPVNNFDRDLLIQYRCSSSSPSDLSCMIGAGRIHAYSTPDRTGYFFGFGASGGTVNVIQRKCFNVAETRKKLPVPGREYQIEIERIGGRWGMRVDGYEILSYLDPHPLLGPGHAHFGLYTYGPEAVFRDIKIYQKPGSLSLEKLRELTQNEIIFKQNPSRIFSMRFEPSIFQLHPATIGLFEEVSAVHELEGASAALGREADADRLERAAKYISENINRHVDFRELARLVSMSYTQFYEKFRARYKSSPMDYQVLLKVNRAKSMLESGRYRVKEIAYFLGYSDERSFQQIFKKRTGCSPAAFKRRRIRG